MLEPTEHEQYNGEPQTEHLSGTVFCGDTQHNSHAYECVRRDRPQKQIAPAVSACFRIGNGLDIGAERLVFECVREVAKKVGDDKTAAEVPDVDHNPVSKNTTSGDLARS